MNSRRPLVSVLTPSFNQGRWLTRNLDSVVAQTYHSIEHVVMDGGSTDNSVEVLRALDAPLIWKSEKDKGQSDALNKAFSASSGEIIGWLNSDDAYVDRRTVETAVKTFERYPDVGVVYGHGLLVNASGRVLQFLWAPPFSASVFRRGTFFVQPSVFIRRSVLTSPMVDESLHYIMDRDLWWRLLETTTFRRINIVAGLDRYQPLRKTLQGGYFQERADYDQQHGINSRSRSRALIAKGLNVGYRLLGVPRMVTVPGVIEAAIPLEFGPLGSRLRFQALTPRRNMPID